MENFTYLLLLLVSLAGLFTIDHRWKLVYFAHKKAALLSLLMGVVFFSLWDILGVMLDIFFIGQTKYLSGLTLAPDFPVEELFFLLLLSYNTLIVYTGASKRWPRT